MFEFRTGSESGCDSKDEYAVETKAIGDEGMNKRLGFLGKEEMRFDVDVAGLIGKLLLLLLLLLKFAFEEESP